MNSINFIVQGINQIKLTDIVILALLVFAIIDFHWHIKNSKDKEKNTLKSRKIFLTWDYKLRKPILYIQIQDKYLLLSLSKEEATTLLEQLKDFQGNNESDKINVLDPKAKKEVTMDDNKLNKEQITIPVALYKKYQKNEVKLEKLENLIQQSKKPKDKSTTPE